MHESISYQDIICKQTPCRIWFVLKYALYMVRNAINMVWLAYLHLKKKYTYIEMKSNLIYESYESIDWTGLLEQNWIEQNSFIYHYAYYTGVQ